MQGLIFTRHTPIYIRTRAKSTTKYHQQKPHGLVAGGWTHHERHEITAHALSRQNFFTLKIRYIQPNLNKINPHILKFNKLVIPLQYKG